MTITETAPKSNRTALGPEFSAGEGLPLRVYADARGSRTSVCVCARAACLRAQHTQVRGHLKLDRTRVCVQGGGGNLKLDQRRRLRQRPETGAGRRRHSPPARAPARGRAAAGPVAWGSAAALPKDGGDGAGPGDGGRAARAAGGKGSL
jgi:hypothetical protein